jgi:integral membrane sensor domain MASE1
MANRQSWLMDRLRSQFDLFILSLSPRSLFLFIIVTLAYFVCGKFGLLLATTNPSSTAFWPPAGIALAAIFLEGRRAWPGIFAGAFLVNLSTTGLILSSLGIATGNTLEAILGVFLATKFANGVNAFFRPGDVLRYVFCAGLLPAVLCAVCGVSILCFAGAANWNNFLEIWRVWWLGDFLGAITVGPFLILTFGFRHERLAWTEIAELALLFSALSVMSFLDFGPSLFPWMPQLFVNIPLLIWAAIRFCPLETSAACLVLSGFALSGSLRGFGPYANTATAPFMCAGYIGVYSLTAMVVAAALMQERKETENLYEEYVTLKEMTAGVRLSINTSSEDDLSDIVVQPPESREASRSRKHIPPRQK